MWTPSPQPALRVATFNLQHGRRADGTVDLDRLTAAVVSLDADILALQEVDRAQPRSGNADLASLIAKATGARSWHFQPVLRGVAGQDALVRANGDEGSDVPTYGIALLSRYEVTDWKSLRLPRLPVRHPYRSAGRWVRVNEEPRSAMLAMINTPLGPLTMINTHLTIVPGSRIRQLRRLARSVRRFPDPVVIAGDLNVAAPWPTRVTRYRSLATTPTFPANQPVRQIDHLLTRGWAVRTHTVSTPELDVSDHRALVVDLVADDRREP